MKKYFYIIILFCSLNTYSQRVDTDYGDIYFEFFQFKEAIKYYDKALLAAKKPQQQQYLYEQLSQCYKYLFQYRKSEEYFKLMMNSGVEVKPEFYIDYGNVLKLNGKYNEAKLQFKKYQEVTGTDLAEPFLRSLNWAIRNADTIKNYDVFATNLDISGQALGYCFYDDGLIYSHARNKPKLGNSQTPLFDLDYARKTGNTEFQSDLKIMGLIEFDLNEGAPCVSSDGMTLYFSANASTMTPGKKKTVGDIEVGEEGISNFKIYAAQSEGGVFQKPVPLNFNDDDYSFVHPFIMDNGNTLFFSSNMPGGFGGFDLYKSVKTEDGKWSEPINMGKVVNSEENELFPWYSDGLFYFTSKGFNNYGGYDIFVAKMNKLMLPSTLKNLGQPINSYRDEVAFITRDGGRTGYFSSNRDNEEGADYVYYFDETIPKQGYAELDNAKNVDTLAVALPGSLSNGLQKVTGPGRVVATAPTQVPGTTPTDPKSNATPATTTTVPAGAAATTGVAAGVVASNGLKEKPANGTAGIATVPAAKPKQATQKTVAGTTPKTASPSKKEPVKPFVLESADAYSKTTFTPVQFKFNDASVNASQMQAADSITAILKSNPTLKVYIAAHADSRGSFQYNMALTERRAAAVKRYFISKGVSSKRIITQGLGESQLLNECADGVSCTEEQHAVNRRVEMKLVK